MRFTDLHIEQQLVWGCLVCAPLGMLIPMRSIAMGIAQAALTSDTAVGSSAKPTDGAGENTSRSREASRDVYLIGPGDMLAVNVWKDPELSRTMPVRPDGRISLPLIGEVPAAGLSAVQLRDLISQKLESYMSHPEVSVTVQEIKSRAFNIIGRVMKAGAYELTKPTTVLDAIALAGGFQDFAHTKKIYILRPNPGSPPSILHFNYKDVIKGESQRQNVQLQPGDTIVVP